MSIDILFANLMSVIIEKGWNSQGIIPNIFIQKAMALGKEFSDEEREFFITMLKAFRCLSRFFAPVLSEGSP